MLAAVFPVALPDHSEKQFAESQAIPVNYAHPVIHDVDIRFSLTNIRFDVMSCRMGGSRAWQWSATGGFIDPFKGRYFIFHDTIHVNWQPSGFDAVLPNHYLWSVKWLE